MLCSWCCCVSPMAISQRLVVGSQSPVRTTFFLVSSTVTSLFVKVMWYAASARTGMERRGCFISLNTWARFAAAGRCGMGSSLVAMESIVVPLAHITLIGSCCIICCWSPWGRKWPVAAVSGWAYAIVFCTCLCILGLVRCSSVLIWCEDRWGCYIVLGTRTSEKRNFCVNFYFLF